MEMSQLMKLKLALDYKHEVLSRVMSLKNILSKALTDGLNDREFYTNTIRHALMVEMETKKDIKRIEQEITKTGYVFRPPAQVRFETRI